MDILNLLKDDHQKLKKILEQIEKTTARTVEKRKALFEKAIAELLVHEQAEESLFYPRLEEYKQAHMLTLEAYEEHHFANVIAAELKETDIADEVWMAKFAVFKENIFHHIKEEQTELFKYARKVLNKKERNEIGKQVQQMKKAAKENAKAMPEKEELQG